MLKDMKDRLTGEETPEVVPPNTGNERMEPEQDDVTMEEDVPVFNTSSEYQWYSSTVEMSSVGDSDEGGVFCIAGTAQDQPLFQDFRTSFVTPW